MKLLDEENQKWYFVKDDELCYAKEQRWGDETYSSLAETVQATPHVIEYSRLHELFLHLGLWLFLTAEGLSFGSGLVQGWTTLYLDYSTIETYTTVSNQLQQALAPYQPVFNFALLMELLVLVLVIVSIVTLHSPKTKLHLGAVICVPITFVYGMIAKWKYASDVAMVTTNLLNSLGYGTYQTFITTQQRFDAAYGFWGTPANILNSILSWASLGFLVAALFTCKANRPTSRTMVAETIAPMSEVKTGATPATAKATETSTPSPDSVTPRGEEKFCRYCGARIPRTSKFCEECGRKLLVGDWDESR